MLSDTQQRNVEEIVEICWVCFCYGGIKWHMFINATRVDDWLGMLPIWGQISVHMPETAQLCSVPIGKYLYVQL